MHGKPAEGTRVHNFSCPDALWEPARAKAAAEGISLGAVCRAALEAFLAAPPADDGEPA